MPPRTTNRAEPVPLVEADRCGQRVEPHDLASVSPGHVREEDEESPAEPPTPEVRPDGEKADMEAPAPLERPRRARPRVPRGLPDKHRQSPSTAPANASGSLQAELAEGEVVRCVSKNPMRRRQSPPGLTRKVHVDAPRQRFGSPIRTALQSTSATSCEEEPGGRVVNLPG